MSTDAFPVGYLVTLLGPEVLQKRCRTDGGEDTCFGRCRGTGWGQALRSEHRRQGLLQLGAVSPMATAVAEMARVQHMLRSAEIGEFLFRGNR